ncbi:hypothetical protein FOZ63_010004 [Perkinsus olseni]|uniref:Uncharacterized protein n=1 Tax=Perkinsus olseni TaxID=32597 RepID=A0A7J6Q223_PEROL|nr:hypothetical protein FOZ63_010004 [Perkinsus olseni]
MSHITTYFSAHGLQDASVNAEADDGQLDLLQEFADYYNDHPIIQMVAESNPPSVQERGPEVADLSAAVKDTRDFAALMTPSTTYGSEKSSCWSGDALSWSQDLRYHRQGLNGDAPEFVPEAAPEETDEPAMNPDAPEFVPAGHETADDDDEEFTRLAQMALQYQIDRVKEQLSIFMARLAAAGDAA